LLLEIGPELKNLAKPSYSSKVLLLAFTEVQSASGHTAVV
jgi:hypothetical protein